MSRELLEAAAKAAGIAVDWDQPRGAKHGVVRLASGPIWNPIDDDGDAFRLAMKLKMRVQCGYVFADGVGGFGGGSGDPIEATRLAIVRAAAAIDAARQS